ncbi:MAG: Gfo/Idh/MocA family oxidoreductase, partial [Chloroflexi bacterium]|nr:Gfo/Idh/MocA family oxidoreductase [Chloroflexota bacterium]
MAKDRLGIGFVGSGFVTGFHLQALVSVRDADVRAIASPTREHAEAAAAQAKRLGIGDPAVRSTVAELAHDPAVDAIWICAPNDTRVAIVEEIAGA